MKTKKATVSKEAKQQPQIKDVAPKGNPMGGAKNASLGATRLAPP